MGNAELKSGFKESLKQQSQVKKLGLTPDILFEEDLINSVTKYIKDTIGVTDFKMEVAFPEGNHQTNENEEDSYKRQFISELSEGLINGYVTSHGNLNILKEPGKKNAFAISKFSLVAIGYLE